MTTDNRLRQNFFDDVSVYVGKAAVDAVVAHCQTGVVDAQQVEDGRVEIVAIVAARARLE